MEQYANAATAPACHFMKRPAVFFDRDGVVNVSPGAGYVLCAEDFHFNPGIIPALSLCRQRGYALVLVTSQQGVGKGHMTQADLDRIHQVMQQTLAEENAAFDLILACTHLKGTCQCRKPSPEMIWMAAEKLELDLTHSWLIGDHDRDILMAQNAELPHTVRVLSHHAPGVAATHTVHSVLDLLPLLSTHLPLAS
jgi:D-glycero-D-manno-heptose 1,7-bisphosphate phosphatase